MAIVPLPYGKTAQLHPGQIFMIAYTCAQLYIKARNCLYRRNCIYRLTNIYGSNIAILINIRQYRYYFLNISLQNSESKFLKIQKKVNIFALNDHRVEFSKSIFLRVLYFQINIRPENINLYCIFVLTFTIMFYLSVHQLKQFS